MERSGPETDTEVLEVGGKEGREGDDDDEQPAKEGEGSGVGVCGGVQRMLQWLHLTVE